MSTKTHVVEFVLDKVDEVRKEVRAELVSAWQALDITPDSDDQKWTGVAKKSFLRQVWRMKRRRGQTEHCVMQCALWILCTEPLTNRKKGRSMLHISLFRLYYMGLRGFLDNGVSYIIKYGDKPM